MGINPTQPNHKAFTFDGTSSRDYGVYITGEGVFNAPQRDVQMVDIPGRNGAYALDKGNFNNITVKYPASIVADNETDFAEAVSDLRNFLCSKTGYCRLEDEYNPDEYRMAIYKSGLEVEHDMLIAGEFDITFECKPQRWLTSGEELITIGEWGETEVVSGSVATFEASDVDKVKSLVAEINPIQDLNGYDSPWVGGGHYNQWDEQTKLGYYDSSTGGFYYNNTQICSVNPIKVEPSTSYYVNAPSLLRVCYYEEDMTFISSKNNQNATITTPANCKYIHINTFANPAYPGGTTYQNDIAINYPSTVTTYSPYENICPISGRNSVEVTVTDDLVDPTDTDTYTTSLGTTVYGGTLDVVSGVLTVTHAIKDMGDVEWTYTLLNGVGSFYAYWNDAKSPSSNSVKANMIASAYQIDTANNIYTDTSSGRMSLNTSGAVQIRNSNYSDATAFTNAMSGQTICYELATPTTVQLTAQQVQTLLGTNNIFADSGDVTVEYGQNPMVLVNPTLFDARPQLQVYGYGDIDLGGQSVKVNNVSIGSVLIANSQRFNAPEYESLIASVGCDVGMLNNGDDILVSNIKSSIAYQTNTGTFLIDGTGIVINSTTNATANAQLAGPTKYSVTVTADDITFSKGTSASSTATVSQTINYKISGVAYSKSTVFTIVTSYDGNDTISFSASVSNITSSDVLKYLLGVKSNDIYGDSSKSALGNPLYIDLDIGECWNEDSGTPVSINNAVTLPAELPTLPIGNTTITFDNTFTQVDIVPRWWKV